jgi:hypothetical protein
MADALDRVRGFQVTTGARPLPTDLLHTRARIAHEAPLRTAFLEARAGGWDAERLAGVLVPLLGPLETAAEVARYLADEFVQVGDGIVIVCSQTGTCLGRVTDEDLWQPPAVPRTDGTMVRPLPRLIPELEADLTAHIIEGHRETAQLLRAMDRLVMTPLQFTEGDRRLDVVTRQGRQDIGAHLRADAPGWWAQIQGSGRGLLDALVFGPPGPDLTLRRALLNAHIVRGIQDMDATSLRYDPRVGLGLALGHGLLRDLVCVLGEVVRGETRQPPEDFDVWLASPGQAPLLPPRGARALYPLDRGQATGLRRGAVVLEVLSPWEVETREWFDRWEIRAAVEVIVGYSTEHLAPLDVPEVVVDPAVAIVR